MAKVNHDLSFLTALDSPLAPTNGAVGQSSEQTGKSLDLLLPVPAQVALPEPMAEPERPSRWASDAQVLEWQAQVSQLEAELRTLKTSQIWSEVETDHSKLEHYQRQANALELAAQGLQGTEKTTFVEAHRSQWVALSESIKLAATGRLAYERQLVVLESVKTALAQTQALLLAHQLDAEEAANRLAHYERQYGTEQGAAR